jgi:HAD superfamily hydrolase (TIGR01509 family)
MILPFAAAIFDMDGTLADNMPLHHAAFRQFIERHRLTPPAADVAAGLTGKRNREIMPILFGRPLDEAELAAFAEEKEALYRAMIPGIGPLAGLVPLLDALEQRGVPLALATSAPAGNVAPLLEAIGVAGRFRVITLGEEVPHGKPAPDIFLEAARRLGVAAERCLVFEDAIAGLVAAGAAGMQSVAMATTHGAAYLAGYGAAMVVRDYREVLDAIGEWPGDA